MTFGEKVRFLRKKNGLSQEKLAEQLGVSQRTVLSYEKNISRPRQLRTYEKLAEALGVDVNYLRSESRLFLEEDPSQSGSPVQQKAISLLSQIHDLLWCGELNDLEALSFVTEVQKVYLSSRTSPSDANTTYQELHSWQNIIPKKT